MKKPVVVYLASFSFFLVALVMLFFWRADYKNRQRAAAAQAATELQIQEDQPDALPLDSTMFQIAKLDLSVPTERSKAVEDCGSCHAQAYENWKAGPHAASFAKLKESQQLIAHSGHFPEAYSNWIEGNISICMSCHASKNIFETRLKGTELQENVHVISQRNFPELNEMAEPRESPDTWSTGTDCFTCHYNGERIVTRGDFEPQSAGQDMPCHPLASPFFTTNTACTSCHGIHVDHLMRFVGNGGPKMELASTETNCISCHQEYDAKGKGTHYFFWRHDDPTRHLRKKVKGGIFDALKTRITSKAGASLLQVDWANTLYPHNFSECGEVVVYLEVLDRENTPVFATDVRLNRKAYHDPDLREQMDGQEPTGSMGYDFAPDSAPLHLEFELPKADYNGGRIKLRAIDKGQYWADDAIGEEIYVGERKL